MHATYRNKPKPEMQIISQSSQFQDDTRASLAYRAPREVESVQAVPTTWDTVYDPDHPDADWSGLVSKEVIFSKKHSTNHPSQRENIERNEQGIVSKDERQEFPRKRVNNESASKNSGSLVIGGIDNPDDRFKTTYRRFESQERTDKDQLILEKRMTATRSVPPPGQSRGSSAPSHEGYQSMMQDMRSTNVGREQKFSSSRNSLLSNLGDVLISSQAVEPPPQKSQQEYKSEQYRTMMADNFKPFPGIFFILLRRPSPHFLSLVTNVFCLSFLCVRLYWTPSLNSLYSSSFFMFCVVYLSRVNHTVILILGKPLFAKDALRLFH